MIDSYLEGSIKAKQALREDPQFIRAFSQAAELLTACLTGGGKLLIAGNGGSAADSQHFAAEIVATLKKEQRRGYPAIALTTDSSFITAWTNDVGFDDVFARQIQALGKPGDVFVGISTSGNSGNIVRAFEAAKEGQMHSIALSGHGGGKIMGLAEVSLVVPSDITSYIQEAHIAIIHALCEEVIPHLS